MMTIPHSDQQDRSQTSQTLGPILVTGAHRSGTTWVGKMLAASGQSAYISEPLNILHRPGVLSTPTRYWYTYITAENETDFLPGLRDTLAYRYHFFAELRSLRSIKDLFRMGRDTGIFLKGRLWHQRTLLKDPFAVFSAPWFASRLNCQVVIVVRHPAAFASSLKRLNWAFDFSDLLDQPLLMKHWLEPYRQQLENASQANTHPDIIYHASLLWNLIYSVVRQYQAAFIDEDQPDTIRPFLRIIRHEDLSRNPVEGFFQLYQELGLEYNKKAKETILRSSCSANPGEGSQKAIYAVRLDSQVNLSNWKRRLSGDEIAQVRELTQELASYYYPEFNWD